MESQLRRNRIKQKAIMQNETNIYWKFHHTTSDSRTMMNRSNKARTASTNEWHQCPHISEPDYPPRRQSLVISTIVIISARPGLHFHARSLIARISRNSFHISRRISTVEIPHAFKLLPVGLPTKRIHVAEKWTNPRRKTTGIMQGGSSELLIFELFTSGIRRKRSNRRTMRFVAKIAKNVQRFTAMKSIIVLLTISLRNLLIRCTTSPSFYPLFRLAPGKRRNNRGTNCPNSDILHPKTSGEGRTRKIPTFPHKNVFRGR
ncbi:unnamed protein product [Nesidiocoris tenuis]|uniref:Uncharacterized protein n=1 Tax=Nesidiocoris tenuis TaxID=355587 RepID=A0A6H5G9U4_9HEMI|nr:unnamed protein product [Nesidiocoris tenuis]